ncbi:MAG: hypothetical protein ABSH53_08910 [Holophaga sp.]|jgi:hypothetical protein
MRLVPIVEKITLAALLAGIYISFLCATENGQQGMAAASEPVQAWDR